METENLIKVFVFLTIIISIISISYLVVFETNLFYDNTDDKIETGKTAVIFANDGRVYEVDRKKYAQYQFIKALNE